MKSTNIDRLYRLLAENTTDVIWTVSVDSPTRLNYISPSVTRLLGYTIEEAMAKTMEEIFTPVSLDFAMKTLVEEMNYEQRRLDKSHESRLLEAELRCRDGSLVPVEINYSFIRGEDGRPVEILAVSRDITKRKRSEDQLTETYKKLKQTFDGITKLIAGTVEMRDPYTVGHQVRVANLAKLIAKEMNFDADHMDQIQTAALVHDIGKIKVPVEILSKPGKLSSIEFTLIKIHPSSASEILKNIEFPYPLARWVLEHHERINGSGYPNGLSHDQISLEGRILAVADVVEAIASHRPYRPALGIGAALEEIIKKKGILYDESVVDACLKLFYEKGFNFEG